MSDRETKIYQLHAAVCRTLAHPRRIEIIDRLQMKEMNAGELAEVMKISSANLSQHLGILRHQGIVETRRDGARIFYRISNPKVIQACLLMREVLIERLNANRKLAELVEEID